MANVVVVSSLPPKFELTAARITGNAGFVCLLLLSLALGTSRGPYLDLNFTCYIILLATVALSTGIYRLVSFPLGTVLFGFCSTLSVLRVIYVLINTVNLVYRCSCWDYQSCADHYIKPTTMLMRLTAAYDESLKDFMNTGITTRSGYVKSACNEMLTLLSCTGILIWCTVLAGRLAINYEAEIHGRWAQDGVFALEIATPREQTVAASITTSREHTIASGTTIPSATITTPKGLILGDRGQTTPRTATPSQQFVIPRMATPSQLAVPKTPSQLISPAMARPIQPITPSTGWSSQLFDPSMSNPS